MLWFQAIASVLVVSAVSLFGITLLSLKQERLASILTLLLSVAAGTLFGDALLHLLPEAVEEQGFSVSVSLAVLAGIVFFFVIEKFIHWRHCHRPEHAHAEHTHPYAVMNLFGDGVHNVIDGLVIGASYLVSVPVGVATTIAVFLHEIPQEVSDFGVLMHGGFSRKRALFWNFLISLGALVGVIIALILGSYAESVTALFIPFAAGAFLYIAGADLIPELQKHTSVKTSLLQLMMFIIGIAAMFGLLFVEAPGHEEDATQRSVIELQESGEHGVY